MCGCDTYPDADFCKALPTGVTEEVVLAVEFSSFLTSFSPSAFGVTFAEVDVGVDVELSENKLVDFWSVACGVNEDFCSSCLNDSDFGGRIPSCSPTNDLR